MEHLSNDVENKLTVMEDLFADVETKSTVMEYLFPVMDNNTPDLEPKSTDGGW